MRILASEAAEAIGGRLSGPDVRFEGASFDSRTLRVGQLFVPIVAERNGHEFIGVAVGAGAPAVLASEPVPQDVAPTTIEVADTSRALLALAQWGRRRLDAKVVGVTGSVGKTSTKDLIAAALSAGLRTTANERSFNNEQGLPVTILDAPDDTQALVLEMGMRGFGEIARLCEVGRPDIGVVTIVGHSHTELLDGLEGVARAKRELVETLPTTGTAILNADDDRVAAMAAYTGAEVLTYGAAGDVRVFDVELDDRARARFSVESPWGSGRAELAVSGAHMVGNAAAAIAVAGVLGVDLGPAIEALSTATLSAMRMEVSVAPSGATVINDAYNANPTSMLAALDALVAVEARRRVAILGLMAEIDDAERAHAEVAAYAAERGIELIAAGTDLYGIAAADDPVAAAGNVGDGDAVLVKASRSAGLERVAELLLTSGATH